MLQQELRGHDGLGRERFHVSLGDTGRIDFNPYQAMGLSAVAFAQGHVLILWTATQVIGIDTLTGSTVSGGRILWQKDLCDPALAANGMGQAQAEYPWGGWNACANPQMGAVGLCGDTLCIQRGAM